MKYQAISILVLITMATTTAGRVLHCGLFETERSQEHATSTTALVSHIYTNQTTTLSTSTLSTSTTSNHEHTTTMDTSLYSTTTSSIIHRTTETTESSAAATSSSHSTTAPTLAPTAHPKKGMSFTNADVANAWGETNVGWAYNWWTGRGSIPEKFEYFPMVWCPTKISLAGWTNDAERAIASGSRHVLAFNEPDQRGQCDIPVEQAVEGYKTYVNQFKGRALLGSPAVTNNPAPRGLNYLDRFLETCAGECHVDFLVSHWYGELQNAVWNFQRHVNKTIDLAQQYGIPQVYITEFGLTGATEEQKVDFVGEVLPWLEEVDAVGGYAYFGFYDGVLMDGDAINVLGQAYADAI